MKCPKCQKDGAKESTYYPGLIVHKCDGKTLEEVGNKNIKPEKESNQLNLFTEQDSEHYDWLR